MDPMGPITTMIWSYLSSKNHLAPTDQTCKNASFCFTHLDHQPGPEKHTFNQRFRPHQNETPGNGIFKMDALDTNLKGLNNLGESRDFFQPAWIGNRVIAEGEHEDVYRCFSWMKDVFFARKDDSEWVWKQKLSLFWLVSDFRKWRVFRGFGNCQLRNTSHAYRQLAAAKGWQCYHNGPVGWCSKTEPWKTSCSWWFNSWPFWYGEKVTFLRGSSVTSN